MEMAAARCESAARLLVSARTAGELFVQRSVGGSGGGGASASGSSSDQPTGGRPVWDIWPQAFHAPSDDDRSHLVEVSAPFCDPSKWISGTNDGGIDVPGRDVNCLSNSIATEQTWRGASSCAGVRIGGNMPGWEGVISDEMGGAPWHMNMRLDEIGDALTRAGHGSSAIVYCTWSNGGAHVFNIVNFEGNLRWVDGQPGIAGEWPPQVFMRDGRPAGYSEQYMKEIWFCGQDGMGNPL